MKKNLLYSFVSSILLTSVISSQAQTVIYDAGSEGYIAGSVIELKVPATGTLSINGSGSNCPIEDFNSGKDVLYSSYIDGVLGGPISPNSTKNESDMLGFNLYWYYHNVEEGTYYFCADEDIFFAFTVTFSEGGDENEQTEMRIILNQLCDQDVLYTVAVPYSGKLEVLVDGLKSQGENVNSGKGCIYAGFSGTEPKDQIEPSEEPSQTGNDLYGYNLVWTYNDFPAGDCYFYCNVASDHVTIKITGIPDETDDPDGPVYTDLTPKILTPQGQTSLEMLQVTWQGATLSFNENERPTGFLTGKNNTEYICNFEIDANTSLLDVTFRDPETGKETVITTPGEYTLSIEAGGILVNGELNRAASLIYTIKEGNSGIEGIAGSQADFPVYNLQGVKVGNSSSRSTLPKGIYIINGKKVVLN